MLPVDAVHFVGARVDSACRKMLKPFEPRVRFLQVGLAVRFVSS
jgi:hypothetical protein